MYRCYYSMYILILQYVHVSITKCTIKYYSMYMYLLQNVHDLLQNVQAATFQANSVIITKCTSNYAYYFV